MKQRGDQERFSSSSQAMFDVSAREQKARKVVAVLQDHFRSTADLALLDIACSSGIMTRCFGAHFAACVGVDIDAEAVAHAVSHNAAPNITYHVMDGLGTAFPDSSFDVVVCNQMYEHVRDAQQLLDEIHRCLRPGGVCYFGATNRLKLMEMHYGLPFLSIIPKPLGHVYLRLLGRARHYYETHLTLWGLRSLVRRFGVIDYTRRIVADPVRFAADDMIRVGSLRQRIALAVVDHAYWLCPGYVWLLRKREDAIGG